MTDAMVAATQFGGTLYPQNVVCNDDERVSERVRWLLSDGDEQFPVELAVGHTHLLVGARVLPLAPGTPTATVDAAVRGAAPTHAVCDYCAGDLAPVAGLLPVPAGACVAALLLCGTCRDFLTDAFPSVHFVPVEDKR